MPADDDERLVERAQERVGTVINGKWTIDRLIGIGGMAVVYESTHRNKKRAALKVLHPELSLDANIRGRFLREGYVANTVEHPGAVRVDDDDVAEDGSAYLVMELLDGETVDARWRRKGGKLPLDEVLSIANQLLDVLVAAHAAGIIHRDLKPENVFLNRGGVLKVLDFGIARLREMGKTSTATRTGSIMGTPAFMAPEQARGRWNEVDGRTDLWAVGAMMFTLLTGRMVHEAETANEVLALAITQPAPPIESIDATLPKLVCKLVNKSLRYAMGKRFPDAKSMQNAVCMTYHTTQGEDVARAPFPSLPDGTLAAMATTAPSQPEALPAAASAQQTGALAATATAPQRQALAATAGAQQPQAARPSGPGATAPAVTRSAAHALTTAAKEHPLGLAAVGAGAVGLLLIIGLVAVFAGSRATKAEPSPSADPAAAAQPAQPTPAEAPPPKQAEKPTSKDKGAVSLDELPVEDDESEKEPAKPKPAAATKDTALAKPKPAPRAAAKPPPPAPEPAKPKPVGDPFSRRR